MRRSSACPERREGEDPRHEPRHAPLGDPVGREMGLEHHGSHGELAPQRRGEQEQRPAQRPAGTPEHHGHEEPNPPPTSPPTPRSRGTRPGPARLAADVARLEERQRRVELRDEPQHHEHEARVPQRRRRPASRAPARAVRDERMEGVREESVPAKAPAALASTSCSEATRVVTRTQRLHREAERRAGRHGLGAREPRRVGAAQDEARDRAQRRVGHGVQRHVELDDDFRAQEDRQRVRPRHAQRPERVKARVGDEQRPDRERPAMAGGASRQASAPCGRPPSARRSARDPRVVGDVGFRHVAHHLAGHAEHEGVVGDVRCPRGRAPPRR